MFQGWDGGKKNSEIQRESTPHGLVLGYTTTGQEGTPSGQNEGPTRPGNPAGSGLHLTSCSLGDENSS